MRLKKGDLFMWKEIIKQGRFDVLRNWLKEAKPFNNVDRISYLIKTIQSGSVF